MKNSYSLKNFILKVALPIVAFWTAILLLGYPIPSVDDLFFIGAAINLAKGGEFINPLIEAWNGVLSSGKFYFQPPFHSYTLAGWLKVAGISTTSFLLFQYLCYNTFSIFCALIFRYYGFPKVTAFGATVLFAVWHCNPNPFYTTGFRQDALGMAYLAFGLWLLTKDNWWRYFLGFTFLESAVFTSPITSAYGFAFGTAIVANNFLYNRRSQNNNRQYIFLIGLTFLAATSLVLVIFLICINFELQAFITDFYLHASLRRTSTINAIPVFIMQIVHGYGVILNLPSYILFLLLSIGIFFKHLSIPIERKILFTALTLGIILNILLYASAIGFVFFFCWLGVLSIISLMKRRSKMLIYSSMGAALLLLSSQTLNIISLLGREYPDELRPQEIRNFVIANPNRKYAIDEVAARFVFDYRLPKDSTCWSAIRPAPASYPSAEDKLPDVIWIVATYNLGRYIPEMQADYPKVEFMGRKFESLPKNLFEITLIP
ncbi:MAG TPA: hypothetical protein V6D28_13185 [Leptolyngbyaceae cyanobacterium]